MHFERNVFSVAFVSLWPLYLFFYLLDVSAPSSGNKLALRNLQMLFAAWGLKSAGRLVETISTLRLEITVPYFIMSRSSE